MRWNVLTGEGVFCTPADMDLLALSSNGCVAAVRKSEPGLSNDTVTIWDLNSGTPIHSLPPLGGRLSQKGNRPPDFYDRDGRFFAFFDRDGRFFAFRDPSEPTLLRIWDVSARRQKGAIPGLLPPDSTLAQPAFSPSGSLLAITDRFDLHIWDLDSRREVATVRNTKGAIWSNDDRFLATRSRTEVRLRLWEFLQPTLVYRLTPPIKTLSFSPDGMQLAVDGSLWTVVREQHHLRLRQASEKVHGDRIVFCAGNQVWAADFLERSFGSIKGGKLKLRQLSPREQEIEIPYHLSQEALAFGSDGRLLAVNSDWVESADGQHPRGGISWGIDDRWFTHTGEVDVWDLASRKKVTSLQGAERNAAPWVSISFSPDSSVIAAAGNGVAVWDVATGSKLHAFAVKRGKQVCVIFRPDGKRVFTGGAHNSVYVYDLDVGREVNCLRARGSGAASTKTRVKALAISPDGRVLYTGSDDRTIRVWNADTGRELARWQAHKGPVNALALSADGKTLVSGGGEGMLKLWNLPLIREELAELGLDW